MFVGPRTGMADDQRHEERELDVGLQHLLEALHDDHGEQQPAEEDGQPADPGGDDDLQGLLQVRDPKVRRISAAGRALAHALVRPPLLPESGSVWGRSCPSLRSAF